MQALTIRSLTSLQLPGTFTFMHLADAFIQFNFYIYIYAFNRRFYPKQLTVHSGYTFVLSVCVFPGNRTHNLCAANATL